MIFFPLPHHIRRFTMMGSPIIHDTKIDHFVKLVCQIAPSVKVHFLLHNPQIIHEVILGDVGNTPFPNKLSLNDFSIHRWFLTELLHWQLKNAFSDSLTPCTFVNWHSSVKKTPFSLPFWLSVRIHGFFILHIIIYYSF